MYPHWLILFFLFKLNLCNASAGHLSSADPLLLLACVWLALCVIARELSCWLSAAPNNNVLHRSILSYYSHSVLRCRPGRPLKSFLTLSSSFIRGLGINAPRQSSSSSQLQKVYYIRLCWSLLLLLLLLLLYCMSWSLLYHQSGLHNRQRDRDADKPWPAKRHPPSQWKCDYYVAPWRRVCIGKVWPCHWARRQRGKERQSVRRHRYSCVQEPKIESVIKETRLKWFCGHIWIRINTIRLVIYLNRDLWPVVRWMEVMPRKTGSFISGTRRRQRLIIRY